MQVNMNKTNQPIRLLQITDCHLGEQLLGLDTEESLIDVLELVGYEQPAVDLVLATGDISGDGKLAAYERFLELSKNYLTAPMVWLPGNHDSLEVMNKALAGKAMPKQILLPGWIVIMLDSSVKGFEHGDLSPQELNFLDRALAEHADRHALICLHHQPVNVGSAWVDQYIVRSASEFFAVVDRHPQVRGICWGHVHQDFSGSHNNIPLWATPSTCVQFKPNCDDFAVDRVMPGYRWFDLYKDGRIVTEVSRTKEKRYSIDYASSGY